MSANSSAAQSRSIPVGDFRQEALSLLRALAGAFIFAMPLLYTLEMWTLGATVDLWKLQVLLVSALLMNIVINYFSSFKEESSWRGALEEAVEATTVGILAAAVVLLVLDRISLGNPLQGIAGKIIVQAVPLSIGASVANSVFRQPANGEGSNGQELEQPEGSGFLNDVGATAVGSVLIAFGIAPTEEVTLLAGEMDYVHILALMVLSLLLSYGIVFASGFDKGLSTGPFHHPLTETVISYLISLLVAGAVLYLLGSVHSGTSIHLALPMIIVLGLPATIGGAAGRLVI